MKKIIFSLYGIALYSLMLTMQSYSITLISGVVDNNIGLSIASEHVAVVQKMLNSLSTHNNSQKLILQKLIMRINQLLACLHDHTDKPEMEEIVQLLDRLNTVIIESNDSVIHVNQLLTDLISKEYLCKKDLELLSENICIK